VGASVEILAFYGLGSAFWGLVIGFLALGAKQLRR
jgi:predicted benzoate:H+ symporter BenE